MGESTGETEDTFVLDLNQHDETPGLIRLTCRSVMPPPAIEHSISQANTTTQSPIQSPARPEPMSPAQQHSEQLPHMNRYGRIIKPPFRFQEQH